MRELPIREQIDVPVREQLIVELYSKYPSSPSVSPIRHLVIQRPTVEAIDEAEGNLQRFAIGPLEPGFGHTIGNSLRRTLLSSIPGAAVTQVRFDDALHEFDTITGVARRRHRRHLEPQGLGPRGSQR